MRGRGRARFIFERLGHVGNAVPLDCAQLVGRRPRIRCNLAATSDTSTTAATAPAAFSTTAITSSNAAATAAIAIHIAREHAVNVNQLPAAAAIQLDKNARDAKGEQVRVLGHAEVHDARTLQVGHLRVGLVGRHDEGDAALAEHGGGRCSQQWGQTAVTLRSQFVRIRNEHTVRILLILHENYACCILSVKMKNLVTMMV